jgi:hypothetical protein
MRVDGVLRLTRARFHGLVRLAGAKIAGSLYMEGTEIIAPDEEQPVLQLNQAAIGDDLRATGLRTQGQIRLSGASVAGSVNLNTAYLSHPGDSAIDAEVLVVEGNFLSGWPAWRAGSVCAAPGSRAGWTCRTPALSNPGGSALLAGSCTMGELWLREGRP